MSADRDPKLGTAMANVDVRDDAKERSFVRKGLCETPLNRWGGRPIDVVMLLAVRDLQLSRFGQSEALASRNAASS